MAKIECSNRLRVVLAEKEITNRWLAEQMGVTDMTVSRWKTNKVQPSMAQFVEIAQLLKVDIKDLGLNRLFIDVKVFLPACLFLFEDYPGKISLLLNLTPTEFLNV